MTLFENLLAGRAKLSVVGLGYVGLPLAVEFAKKLCVIGFDIDEKKIAAYKKSFDVTGEIGNEKLREAPILFSSDAALLREAKFHIVSVPTPINPDHSPNLSALCNACEFVGKNLTAGSIVVYESTVYPGLTEEICIPILEKFSGMICGEDFKVGYSPERINPSDKEHSLPNIVKIVSGIDAETLDTISKVYALVVKAGVYPVKSIRIAEAAKIIENIQRDINIALMNELSIIFHKMGIDTQEVLQAAGTKWNFLKFYPGLVGGHCIGVDPYYLTYKAKEYGYHSNMILAGRRINDNMGIYIAANTIKCIINAGGRVKKSVVAILGVTFKENCADVRNSKVFDIVKELKEYAIETVLIDPLADPAEVYRLYGVQLKTLEQIEKVSAIIIAVAHKNFCHMNRTDFDKMYCSDSKILLDIKGIMNRKDFEQNGYSYWRL